MGPFVTRKFASLPASRLPTLSYTPRVIAGVFVKASIAFVSLKPYSIALRRLAQKVAVLLRSDVVKQQGIPAFSNAAAFVGASSHCFISSKETNRASLGSSTSIACG